MKNRFIVVYTIFAALVFVFSLSFFGYNLYREYHINQEKSEKQFNQLISSIRTISSQQPENTAEYVESVKKSIGTPVSYAFIELKRDNQIILQYPAGSTKQDTSSNMTRSFESTISVSNKNITFSCNYYLIHPDSIFYYARVSFLMILIITLITVIMIIYLNVTEKSSSQFDTEKENETSGDDQGENLEESDEAQTENTEQSENSEPSEQDEQSEQTEQAEKSNLTDTDIPESENSSDSSENSAAESSPAEASETETQTESEVTEDTETKSDEVPESTSEAPAELPVNDIKPAAASSDNPSGLYNPDTEISWESYLSTRLDNEIDRATASEIDLSLFIFKFPETKNGSEQFKNICNYLTIQFQFKDLLFEFKDDCIVAIKISMDVDSAIAFADKLYADIENIIDNKKCYIGITSRSIRIVTGERLMLEAEQAVEHAINDNDSPIIAFRVDSDKYRQMLEQH